MSKKRHFFIDESGDPTFYRRRKHPLYEKPDFDPILILGMVVIENRKHLQDKIIEFQKRILADPLFNTIPSLCKPNWFLHASKDHVDVRLKFIEFLREQSDIKCYIVIGRKIPEIFHNKHNGKASEFYFDLLKKLLALYQYTDGDEYMLFLSERQSNTQERFINALEKALKEQSKHFVETHFKCRIVPSRDYAELSIIDYFLWAIRRFISEGDRRYFAALENKFEKIYDIYENEGKGRIYDSFDVFEISKASPFGIK